MRGKQHLLDVAKHYIDETTFAPDETKQKALQVINDLITTKIVLNKTSDIRKYVTSFTNLVGNANAILGIVNILKVNEQPIPLRKRDMKKIFPNGRKMGRNWSSNEDARLLAGIYRYGVDDWKKVAQFVGNGRTKPHCSQRWNRVLNPMLKKDAFTEEEDAKLMNLVKEYGEKSWKKIAEHFMNRSDAQCRYRYVQLQKGTKRIKKSPHEVDFPGLNKTLNQTMAQNLGLNMYNHVNYITPQNIFINTQPNNFVSMPANPTIPICNMDSKMQNVNITVPQSTIIFKPVSNEPGSFIKPTYFNQTDQYSSSSSSPNDCSACDASHSSKNNESVIQISINKINHPTQTPYKSSSNSNSDISSCNKDESIDNLESDFRISDEDIQNMFSNTDLDWLDYTGNNPNSIKLEI